MITISKSSYIRGLQCTKSFYLNFFHKQIDIARDDQDKKIFEIGHDVGKYAQQLFPGGVDCGFEITRDRTKSIELTKQAIAEGKEVIYEAAFEYDGLLCFIDILVKQGNQWVIYEVKSSTSVKEYHINDSAFQYYVISNNIPVKDVFVVCLNNQYVRNGEIDINQLFVKLSVLDQAVNLQSDIKINVEEYKKLTESNSIPDVKIGKQCDDPFACDFKGYCWKDIPEYSVFDIQNMRGKDFELYNMGIVEIKDIPKDFKLNDKQLIEVNSYLENTDYIDKSAIKDFLSKISYPLYFLDFETYQSAIPEFNNSRSYQQIPFQFSMYYKESKDSEAIPYSFLAEPAEDQRRTFAESLIKLTENPGLIIVYNAGFEKSRINELARDFPEYEAALNSINNRIVDLMEPFRAKAYYKPGMRSSFSMKTVLPAIDPKYSYENLNIHEGSEASNEFLRMKTLNEEKEINDIRRNLIDYCNQDTYGMIVILEELERQDTINISTEYSLVWQQFGEDSDFAKRFYVFGKSGYLPFLINKDLFNEDMTLQVEVDEYLLLKGILVGMQDSRFMFRSKDNDEMLLNLLDELSDGFRCSSVEQMILDVSINLGKEFGIKPQYYALKTGVLKCPNSSKILSDLTLVITEFLKEDPTNCYDLFEEIITMYQDIDINHLDHKAVEYLIYINFVAIRFNRPEKINSFLENYVYKYINSSFLKNKIKHLLESNDLRIEGLFI